MGKKIRVSICIIAAVIGVWQGLEQLGLFQEFSGARYYELEEKVSVETAAAMRVEEAGNVADLVLWDFLDGQTVSIQAPVGRTGRVSVVTVCGEPMCLTGNFTVPHCGDTQGCLLDGGTARSLFGTEEATGETIIYQGKEYKIKGILDKMEPTMLIQASADYRGGFSRMTLSGSRLGDWELENRIRNKYGISLVKIDWGMVRTAVKLIFCAMSLSVCVSVWRRFVRGRFVWRRFVQKKFVWRRFMRREFVWGRFAWGRLYKDGMCRGLTDKTVSVLGVTAGIILFFGLLRMTGIRGIPAAYIPPQWSDFEFYRNVWENLGDAWKNLVRLSCSTFELRMVQNSVILCLDIVLTGAALRYLAVDLCGRIFFGNSRCSVQGSQAIH